MRDTAADLALVGVLVLVFGLTSVLISAGGQEGIVLVLIAPVLMWPYLGVRLRAHLHGVHYNPTTEPPAVAPLWKRALFWLAPVLALGGFMRGGELSYAPLLVAVLLVAPFVHHHYRAAEVVDPQAA